MRNIFAVHVFDTQKDLFDEVGGFPLRQALFLGYKVEELATSQSEKKKSN